MNYLTYFAQQCSFADESWSSEILSKFPKCNGEVWVQTEATQFQGPRLKSTGHVFTLWVIPARTGGTRVLTRPESSSRRHCPEIQHYSQRVAQKSDLEGQLVGGEERRYQGDSLRWTLKRETRKGKDGKRLGQGITRQTKWKSRAGLGQTPLEKGVRHSFPREGVLALVLSEFLVFSSRSDFFFLDLNVFFYKMQVTRLKDE